MKLFLTAEQLEYQKLAKEFAERELKSNGPIFDQKKELPLDILAKMQGQGLVNVRIPEALGGLGLSTLEACLIAQELAEGDSGIAAASEASELAITALLVFGSEEQKKELLKPLVDKSGFAGLAITESNLDNSMNSSLPLKAVQKSDHYLFSGTVPLVANAHIADWFLLEAEIVDSPQKEKWGAFIVRANSGLSNSGLVIGEKKNLLGRIAADVASITCKELKLPPSARLIIPGKKEAFTSQFIRQNFPIIAAGCLGVSQAAFKHALAYAQTRETFGKPIVEHQAVAFMLADMAKDIQALQLLILKATSNKIDTNQLAQALTCKAFAQETVMKITTDAVQIFGGYGYTKEYPVEKLMRDAKNYQLFFGTSAQSKSELGKLLLPAL